MKQNQLQLIQRPFGWYVTEEIKLVEVGHRKGLPLITLSTPVLILGRVGQKQQYFVGATRTSLLSIVRKGRHEVVVKLKFWKNLYWQRDIKKFYVEPWVLMDWTQNLSVYIFQYKDFFSEQ